MWTKQTANGGRDMGKQVRKSAETAHSRMQGDWRPEKHISVQTGRGRDSVHVCERERGTHRVIHTKSESFSSSMRKNKARDEHSETSSSSNAPQTRWWQAGALRCALLEASLLDVTVCDGCRAAYAICYGTASSRARGTIFLGRLT